MIDTNDVPQTRELRYVRAIVEVLAGGDRTTQELSAATGIAPRQVLYAIVTARALGLLDVKDNRPRVTPEGHRLLETLSASTAERELLLGAVRRSPVIQALAPGLLDNGGATKESIISAIRRATGLGAGTASHRAGAFLAWRKQLSNMTLDLPMTAPKNAKPSPPGPQQSRDHTDDAVLDDAEIDRIRRKLASNQYHQLLRSVTINGLRGFKDCKIEFPFPIVAVVGENGSGKTTVLKAAACAYEQGRKGNKSFSPALFFLPTQWDKVSAVTIGYSIKHGNEDRPVSLRKRTERWRGIETRPKRHVYFFDISRTMPADALIGYAQIAKKSIKLPSHDLEASMRHRLSWVMGRTYKEARFALSRDKRLGVLTQEFGQYSKFHQGAGEASALDLFGALEAVPDNSLVLVDEVEASLHPKAQRRFIRTLLWLCRTKTLQLIISTHSQFILEELPPEARILLIKGRDTKVVYGASPEYCLSTIDERAHPDLTIFVEDRAAEVLLRELLVRADNVGGSSLLSRVDILPVGPANVVALLDTLGLQRTLRYRCMGVVDPDAEEGGTCLRLPGSIAPERQIFRDLGTRGWPQASERFGVPPGEMIAVLEDAARIPDHHDWCAHVGNKIKMSKHRVWENLATIWVRECVTPAELATFVDRIFDRMP